MSIISEKQQRQDERTLGRFLIGFNLILSAILVAICYLQSGLWPW
jgi:hypothetical protein